MQWCEIKITVYAWNAMETETVQEDISTLGSLGSEAGAYV